MLLAAALAAGASPMATDAHAGDHHYGRDIDVDSWLKCNSKEIELIVDVDKAYGRDVDVHAWIDVGITCEKNKFGKYGKRKEFDKLVRIHKERLGIDAHDKIKISIPVSRLERECGGNKDLVEFSVEDAKVLVVKSDDHCYGYGDHCYGYDCYGYGYEDYCYGRDDCYYGDHDDCDDYFCDDDYHDGCYGYYDYDYSCAYDKDCAVDFPDIPKSCIGVFVY
jgi:hypothetical protein